MQSKRVRELVKRSGKDYRGVWGIIHNPAELGPGMALAMMAPGRTTVVHAHLQLF